MTSEKIQILLIENDDNFYNSIESQLPEIEICKIIREISNIDELISIKNNVDFILLDDTVNDIPSKILIKKIRFVDDSLPIIFLSSNTNAEFAVNIMKAGADDYIYKDNELFKKLQNSIFEIKKKSENNSNKEKIQADLLRTIIDAIPNPIYYKDKSGEYLACNTQYANYLGIDKDVILNSSIEELAPENYALTFHEADMELMKHNESVIFETKLLFSDKTFHDVIYYKTPILNEDKSIRGLTGIIFDITERKRAKKKLVASEIKYRELFDHMSSGVTIYEASKGGDEFIIKDINKAGELIDRIYKKEILNKKLTDVYKDIDDENILNTFKEVWRTGGKMYFPNVRFSPINKRKVLKELWIYKLPLGEVVAIYNDITKRKNSEAKIVESELKYRSIFEQSADSIIVFNQDGIIQSVNKNFQKLSGFAGYKLIGKNIKKFLPKRSKKESDFLSEILNSDESVIKEHYIFDKEKNLVPVEMHTKKIMDGRIQTIMRNLTERKQTQKRILNAILKAEEMERKRFSKDLHDGIGAILSTLKIYINMIINDKLDASEKQDIHKLTYSLIEEAIVNSRAIAYNLEPKVVDNHGLKDSIIMLCNKIKNTGILNIDLEVDNLKIDLDHKLEITLYKVLNEMFNNTIKHAEAKNVKIKLFNKQNFIHLKYKDDGKGFDCNSELKTNKSGLSNIIYRIDSLKGKVDMFSIKNKGTKFNIVIEN